jgi:OOP family OmpA-OmpF porin
MKVVSDAIEPASVSPYEWRGEKKGSDVILTGYVPSPEAKADVDNAAGAAFPGMTMSDRIRIAAGEPKMDWIGAIKFSLAALAKLGTGTVTLGDKTFAIEGEAASPDAFAELLDINSRTLPASLVMVKSEVTPPRVSPYRFMAERGAGQVVLSGYAPSEKDKEAILDMVRGKFGPDQVVDKLVFASGAPQGFTAAIADGLHAVTRLAGGSFEMVDAALKIEGDAYYPAAADQVAGAAEEGKPADFVVTAEIGTRQDGQPAGSEHCRDLLTAELQRGRVAFQGAKAEIADDSYGLLDRVAATLVRCPDAKVEVGAHTDSEGSAARNRDLTQARAEAIVDYLVDAGVMRERLTPVGYGETKAIADNNTPAGRAQNRRIEFTVEVPGGG